MVGMSWNSSLSALKWASLIFILAASSFVQSSYAQGSEPLAGDWQGAILDEGPALFYRLDGGGTGTAYWTHKSNEYEPIDWSVNGNQITIHFPSTTSYVATLNGTQMNGTLSQPSRSVPLILTKSGAPAASAGTPGGVRIPGDWQGILPGNLPIVIHAQDGGAGKVEITTSVDPDPIHYSVTGSQITIVESKATYTGTLSGNTIIGTWSRAGGKKEAITLTKAAPSASTEAAIAASLKASAAVHDAAANGDLAKVQVLVKNNPSLVFNKDNKGETPLHLAAYTGHKDVAEFLLANNAEVNAKDNSGMTPMRLAVLYGYKDVAELLKQHGGHE